MPLYEYACPSCGTFEIIQKFADAALERCPTCASGVTKLLSAPAFQFKGTGWYVTDYARKGASEGKKKDGGGSPDSAAKKSEGPASASGGSSEK